ncbi:MAG: hypothetical protein FWH27_08710 [Planctomycetaceae bacterium]|nr:hypothetical protein [Planctomycetaceae bacterium]
MASGEWLVARSAERNTLHSAFCTLHSAFCTLHSAFCTLHSAFCTLHSALCTASCRIKCFGPSGLLLESNNFLFGRVRPIFRPF